MIEGNNEFAGRSIKANNNIKFIICIGGHTDAASLTHSVAVQATMCPQYDPIDADDLSRLIINVVFEEIVDVHIAEKADALTVFLCCIGELLFSRQITDCRFFQLAYREQCLCQLFLFE